MPGHGSHVLRPRSAAACQVPGRTSSRTSAGGGRSGGPPRLLPRVGLETRCARPPGLGTDGRAVAWQVPGGRQARRAREMLRSGAPPAPAPAPGPGSGAMWRAARPGAGDRRGSRGRVRSRLRARDVRYRTEPFSAESGERLCGGTAYRYRDEGLKLVMSARNRGFLLISADPGVRRATRRSWRAAPSDRPTEIRR